jgi:hypothetical protein
MLFARNSARKLSITLAASVCVVASWFPVMCQAMEHATDGEALHSHGHEVHHHGQDAEHHVLPLQDETLAILPRVHTSSIRTLTNHDVLMFNKWCDNVVWLRVSQHDIVVLELPHRWFEQQHLQFHLAHAPPA